MEDIKKLLEQNEDYFMSSSEENGSDSETIDVWNLEKGNSDLSLSNNHVLEIKSPNSVTSKKRNGEQRLPTRRPDPNVYNRNALLARENRRKKKAYLETIEKELQVARKANRVLAKALKRQMKVAQRLEQEKKFFEGLIANRSEILTLVNALNFRRIPESESDMSLHSSSSNNDDHLYNGMKNGPSTTSISCINDTDSHSIHFDSLSDDLENGTDSSLANTWDDIWGNDGYNIDNLILPESTLLLKKCVNNDHCYVSTATLNSIQTLEDKSQSSDYIDVEGDCSHVSVFPSGSDWNQECRTPPLQILSDHPSLNILL